MNNGVVKKKKQKKNISQIAGRRRGGREGQERERERGRREMSLLMYAGWNQSQEEKGR